MVSTEVGPVWAGRGGPHLGQRCWQPPPVHPSGAEGAGAGQEQAALIAEASAPSLPTRWLPATLL